MGRHACNCFPKTTLAKRSPTLTRAFLEPKTASQSPPDHFLTMEVLTD
jgi:hypothetical protein